MDDTPAARGAHRAARPVSRRTVLISGVAAVVAGAAGGGTYAAIRPVGRARRPAPPADLVAALSAEADLIAAVDAAIAADGSLRTELTGVRSDHVAHQLVLRAALADYAPAPVPSPSSPLATAPTRAALRTGEARAAADAAARASRLTGRVAAVLASVSACEATHAELLS
jgi:hypothetical protein